MACVFVCVNLLQLNCSKVRAFLNYRLGQYITNVTRAAEVCSDYLCQSNGRCMRKDPRALHYLHLSKPSYRITSLRNGSFSVVGQHSQQDLQLLTDRFQCHCYQGYGGERCDSLDKDKETDKETGTEGEDKEKEKEEGGEKEKEREKEKEEEKGADEEKAKEEEGKTEEEKEEDQTDERTESAAPHISQTFGLVLLLLVAHCCV